MLAYLNSNDEFQDLVSNINDDLTYYNKLFDIYHEYGDMNNMMTLTKIAGLEPVKVSDDLLDFISFCVDVYSLTNGEVNIMMGSVISEWKKCSNSAMNGLPIVPDDDELIERSKHIDISKLIINKNDGTVFIEDSLSSIDVGAIAKGYVADVIAKKYSDIDGSVCLNLGGNVIIFGNDINQEWKVGIQNPLNLADVSKVLVLHSGQSCVTSGSYQRYFEYNGVKYHHIIDKDTLYPSNYFNSISVIYSSSAICDSLSTALFNMEYSEGINLVKSIDGVETVYIDLQGNIISD